MIKWLILISLFSSSLHAQEIGRLYFKHFLGHVHESPDRDSASLTTLQCSHAVKILKMANSIKGWMYTQVGEDKGYIQSDFLTEKRPDCFQEKYPRFYVEIGLDITEMYHWGKLYDHYSMGKSKIK